MPTAATNPTVMTTAEPDASLTDAATAALESTQEWRIATGKATRRKAKAAVARKRWMATPRDETPNNQHGGRGKKAHQPMTNHHPNARTWADIVQSGGINVQIVLGNSNL
jgi:hypothetical protein